MRTLPMTNADGRCCQCGGQVLTGGCPRCDAVQIWVIPSVSFPPTVVTLTPTVVTPARQRKERRR